PRAGGGPDRVPGDRGPPAATHRVAPVRDAEARGARPSAGAGAGGPAARRADGRDEPGREGGHGAVHPRCQRRVGDDHHPDRARHGRGHGHLGPGRGAGPRPEDRRGDAGGGARRPPRRHGLPGRAGRRGPVTLGTGRPGGDGTGREPDGETLVQLLVAAARARPDRPAMREREKGIWREYSRAEVLDHVRRLALGLHALGLRPGDKVALLTSNRPEAFWMILAAQALRAVPVPLYQDAIAREVQYVVHHSDARLALAEDQEQVDKL